MKYHTAKVQHLHAPPTKIELIEKRDSLNELFFIRFLKSPVFVNEMFAKHGYVPGELMLCAYIENDKIVVRQVICRAGKYTSFNDSDDHEHYRPESHDSKTLDKFRGECIKFLKGNDKNLYEEIADLYVEE